MGLIVNIPGKEPIFAVYRGDKILQAAVAGSLEARRAEEELRSRGHMERLCYDAVPKSEASRRSPDSGTSSPSRSTRAIERLKLVTNDVHTATTGVGYVIAEKDAGGKVVPCLKVEIADASTETKQVRQANFIVGHLATAAVASLPVNVSTKQTPRMRWFADVWKKVLRHVRSGPKPPSSSVEFEPLHTTVRFALSGSEKLRLLMLMRAHYWEAESMSDSACIADLDGLRLPAQKRGNFFNLRKRLGLVFEDATA